MVDNKLFSLDRVALSVVFWLVSFSALCGQTGNPTISSCSGLQYLCATGPELELCVDIQVNPAYPFAGIISLFEIDWGDNTPVQTVPGGLNPPGQVHLYDLSDFYDSCSYERTYVIKLKVIHTNPAIEPANNAFVLTVRNPPKAQFCASSVLPCVNTPVVFTGTGGPCSTCDDQQLTYQQWTVQGQGMTAGNTVNTVFTTPGPVGVQYCAGNVCDTVCTNAVFTVFDIAKAAINPDSGATFEVDSRYKLCLDSDTAFVRLDGSVSAFANQFAWEVDGPPGGWSWYPDPETPDTSVTRLAFTKTGLYRIYLEVDNLCRQPDLGYVEVEVVELPPFSLMPQGDSCVNISYTPLPLYPGAQYRINGLLVDSFPVYLPKTDSMMRVEASLNHFCGFQERRDTFWLNAAPEIVALVPDTVVCLGADTIPMASSPPGRWTGGPGLQVSGNTAFFVPVLAGNFPVIVSRGFGVCRRADTLHIGVDVPYPVQLEEPDVACIAFPYTPYPFDSLAVYSINGMVQAQFPVLLDAVSGPYTIQAVVENACGLSEKSVLSRVLSPEDVSIYTPDTALCAGSAKLRMLITDTVGYWQGAFLTGSGTEVFFDPVVAGVYPIVYTRGTGICYRADTAYVEVVPTGQVEAGANLEVCSTDTLVVLGGYTPGLASGAFFNGIGVTGDVVNTTGLLRNAPYIYQLTSPDLPAGCNSDTRILTVRESPVVGFVMNRDSACQGDTIRVYPFAGPSFKYRVDWGDGTSGSALEHVYTAAGNFWVVVESFRLSALSGLPMCVVRDSALVSIPSPFVSGDVDFKVVPSDGCAPLSVTVENVGTATGVPYWWQFGDGPVYNGNVLPPQVLFDGVEDTTYILRLSVPNGCGPATVEKPIVVRARPKARLGLVYPEPCSGSVLEASVLSVGNAVQNTWYTSTGQVVTGSLIQPSSFQFYTDSVVRVVDVWLVTTNACGSDTAYGQVVVKPAEVAAQIGLADSRPRCAGAEFSLLNFSTPGASVYWTLSNGAQYLGDSIRLAFDDPGTYAVTLHAFGCGYDSVIFPLVVHPQPELDWQYPLVGCPGDTLVFKLLTDAEGSVLRFGDGDSTFNRMVSHVYRTSGVYHPQVEVVTALGCKDKLEGSLEILPVPSVMAESADSVCGGQAVRFEGAVTGPVASSWWEFGGGEVLPGSVVDYTFDGTGVFGVVFHATSDLGCSASDTVSVYVRDYAEAIIAADISQGCAPVEVSLMRTGAGVAGVVWDLGNGQVVVGNTAVVTYSIPGTYEVMLVTTNGGICPDTALLTVKAGAAVQYDLDIAQACLETEGATLTIRTDAANLVRVGGPAYTRTGVIHPNLPEGVYTVGIQSAEGCRADTVVTVLGNDELYLTVVEDSFAILLGDSVFLQAVVNQPGVAFRWSPVPGLSRTDAPLVVARPARTTRYVVEATNAGGCVKWDTVFIRVDFDREAGVFLPNAFTPNGDGVNDIFYLRSSSPMLLGIDYFRIYDLYNETVFDVSALSDGVPVVAEDPRFGWDGNFRGSKAELGSYRYTLAVRYIDGYLKVFTGTVQLIR